MRVPGSRQPGASSARHPSRRLKRLHAIVELLRARRTPLTVAELAERFGVTERTMFRDLAALRESDIPIEADGGPGGGVRLSKTYHLPPIGLSVDEAVALWLAVSLRSAAPTGGAALKVALDKIVGAIPREQRGAFEDVTRRIVIGTEPWETVAKAAGPVRADVYRACERAVTHGFALELDYTDKRGNPSRRLVEPHGLLAMEPVWYLLAFDRTRNAPRSLRLDRISAVVERPEERFEPQDPRPLFPAIHMLRLERG